VCDFHIHLANGSTAVVCYYPQDMRALSVANLMGNGIGKEQLAKLQEIMRSKPNLVSLCGIADDATEADLSGLRMDADDAIVLASELPDKGAMTSLNLASNELKAEGAKIVADAIKVTSVHLRSFWCHFHVHLTSQSTAVVCYCPQDMRALTKFDISNNSLYAAGGKVLAESLNGNQVMTELNLAKNTLGRKANSGGKADMSGIIAIADVIPGMGAMTSLNISNNDIGKLVPPEGWSNEHSDCSGEWRHTDGRKQRGWPAGSQPQGVIALADGIKNMRAMTALNLASNELGAEGAKIVAEAIKVTKSTPAIVLVPFSCPSDFSINCCCLLLSAGYGGDDEPESCVE
jgi:hypothetical protein